MNQPSEIQQSVINDVVSYLKRCEIPAYFINPRLVQFALEASYKPQPVFWRALDRATVLRALENHAPGFKDTLSFVEENAYDILVDRIDFMLELRHRDEMNAEILLAVPADKRQAVFANPLEYLVLQLRSRGQARLAKDVIADKERGPDAALELVEAQLAAKEGRPFMTELMREAIVTSHAFIIDRPFDVDDSEDD
ncbi:hypothetical protein [Paraburkholderia sp. BCC1884]|uniref:hypothetical protein n=1 Tax=Paraburkholderia sp. BCC1884 TaxID=2562668 RepID=UPI00118257DF|nr:hypothetical protein [Paraburkholderia sp. BCC1884]